MQGNQKRVFPPKGQNIYYSILCENVQNKGIKLGLVESKIRVRWNYECVVNYSVHASSCYDEIKNLKGVYRIINFYSKKSAPIFATRTECTSITKHHLLQQMIRVADTT